MGKYVVKLDEEEMEWLIGTLAEDVTLSQENEHDATDAQEEAWFATAAIKSEKLQRKLLKVRWKGIDKGVSTL